MRFISLHTKNTTIVYKNLLCSSATLIVVAFSALSILVPVLLVSLFSPYSGIAEFRIVYEQPEMHFKYQGFVLTETLSSNRGKNLIACSIMPHLGTYFYDRFGGKHCEHAKYWVEDTDHDTTIDRAHFAIKLDDTVTDELLSMQLILLFEAKLKNKCLISAPTILTHSINLPSAKTFPSGIIVLKAELQLKQSLEFICPFSSSDTRIHFKNTFSNNSYTGGLSQLQMESLLMQIKDNSAYFELSVQETYFKPKSIHGVSLNLDLEIPQVLARYHLSVLERLGQYWLYFASFFGVSFYVVNKLKDILFGCHIIPACEVIPWKRIY